MANDYAFEMATSAVRFGFGVTREVGAELADQGKVNGIGLHGCQVALLAAGGHGARIARRAQYLLFNL